MYLAGIAEVAAASGELEQVLEDAAADGGMSRKAAFALTMISGSLPACMVYVSRRELLIRPLIAPTKYHQAFTGAAQRVYMSATLGEGGELERAFGRRAIRRIPVPAGWETQGTGRRFFAFPDLLSGLPGEPQLGRFVSSVIESYRKAVLIAPSDRARDRAVELMVPEDMPVWEPQEYAEDPAVFADAAEGVLALANRYDGIDLPDDVCRLVVLAGLPVGMHLQERFLHDSLAALSVLTERIRTRLTQGTGRATRNSSDYAAVILLGRELVDVLRARGCPVRQPSGAPRARSASAWKTPAVCQPARPWRTCSISWRRIILAGGGAGHHRRTREPAPDSAPGFGAARGRRSARGRRRRCRVAGRLGTRH